MGTGRIVESEKSKVESRERIRGKSRRVVISHKSQVESGNGNTPPVIPTESANGGICPEYYKTCPGVRGCRLKAGMTGVCLTGRIVESEKSKSSHKSQVESRKQGAGRKVESEKSQVESGERERGNQLRKAECERRRIVTSH